MCTVDVAVCSIKAQVKTSLVLDKSSEQIESGISGTLLPSRENGQVYFFFCGTNFTQAQYINIINVCIRFNGAEIGRCIDVASLSENTTRPVHRKARQR